MADQVKPYIVRTTTGTLRSQHDTDNEAQSAAAEANAEAQRLGIQTRYESSAR